MGLLGMLSGATSGGGVNVGSAIAYLELNTQAFDTGISTALSKLDGAKNGLATGLKNVGSSMKNVGSTLTKTVTLPVVGLGTAAVKSFASFEQGMAEVTAIAGQVSDSKDFQRIVNIGKEMGLSWDEGADMTATAMNIVKAKAEEMGATTEWTSTEAAEAFKYMAMAGWDVGDMLLGIEPIMNLATASGEDLGTTSDIVTDALTAFGLSANDTAHFTDILAQAARSSNTTVQKMGESFKFAAPVMGSMGMSAEDAALALGLMANNGIKSGMAGRTLRTILTNLVNPTDEMKAAMDELGITIEQEADGSISFKKILDQLRNSFRGGQGNVEEYTKSMALLDAQYAEGKITEEEYEEASQKLVTSLYGVEGAHKAQLAAMLAGKTGMSGLLAIVNSSEDDYNRLTDVIANCTGATNEMADIMRDTTYGSLKLMTSALDALARSFGELLAPIIREAAKYIKELAEKFNSLDDSTKETIIKFAGIAAVVGPLLIILGSLCTAISNIITLGSTLIGGLAKIPGLVSGITSLLGKIPSLLSSIGSFFTSTFGAITMIIGGAITAIVNFVSMWQNGWDIIKTILEALGIALVAIGAIILGAPALITAVIAAIIFAISQLAIVIHDNWDAIKQWFSEAMESIKQWWNDLCDSMKEKWQAFKDWLSETWESIKQAFSDAWNAMKDFFMEVWNAIKDFFVELWDSLVQKVLECIDAIKEFVRDLWERAKEWFATVKETVNELFENIKEKIKSAFDWIKERGHEFIENAKSKLRDFFDNVKEKVRELKEKIIETVRDMFENIKNKISEAFDWIKNKLHDFLENAKNKIRDAIQYILDKVRDFKEKVIETLRELFDQAKQKFEEMISLIREKISEIVQTVREKISEIVQTVREKIQEIVDTVKEWLGNLIEAIKEKLQQIWDAITEGLSNIISAIKEKCEEIWNAIKEFASKIKEGASQLFETLVEKIKGFASRFWEAGKMLFNKLWEGIKEVWNQITAWVDEHFGGIIDKINNVVSRVREAASSIGDFFDGSHATGLSYVPYNGYIAQLHEGERVLTKQENREYSEGKSGGGGNTYNIYSYEKLDEYNIRRELEKMKRQLDL